MRSKGVPRTLCIEPLWGERGSRDAPGGSSGLST